MLSQKKIKYALDMMLNFSESIYPYCSAKVDDSMETVLDALDSLIWCRLEDAEPPTGVDLAFIYTGYGTPVMVVGTYIGNESFLTTEGYTIDSDCEAWLILPKWEAE